MAKDFAPETKTRYLKGPNASKVATKSNNFYRVCIYLTILCGLITCLFLLYIQNGMHGKLNFAAFTPQTNLKPKFEFYKILSNTTVAQPSEPINNNKISKDTVSYMLQIAAFKEYTEAENLRAKLLLAGIDVDIYSIKFNENNIWYRIRSKKSQNYQDIKTLQQKLLVFNLSAIILKDIS